MRARDAVLAAGCARRLLICTGRMPPGPGANTDTAAAPPGCRVTACATRRNLPWNRFTGDIPDSISSLTNLQDLCVSASRA